MTDSMQHNASPVPAGITHHEVVYATMASHPMDALNPTEIEFCSAACREFAQIQGEELLRFNAIALMVRDKH
jgi:hypothetical protein